MNATVINCDMTHLEKQADWWRGAVIYQIYPRSFQDDNGDGIGDLRGITRRLPYIASLGVDAIWISPFFTSPMKDFGYDVSDYRDVDPMFGTLADFDTLVRSAHGQGLKVMIDLVLSHSSDQHPWFAESRADRDNEKANWYVWADAKPDGTPPNNWLSIFGGSAWTWDARRCQYFLHNFLVSQPDLNFHEPAVQDALLDVARFWLERGVDGFRLDTINFYTHDAKLRDNPALPPDARNSSIAPAVNPYNHQEHLYDKNRPETLDFLRKLRAVMDPYGAAAVGEVGDAQRGLEIMGEYTAGDDLVQMCYAFELLSGDQPDAAGIAALMDHVARVAKDGWACWAYSNHDVMRHATRWNLTEEAQKLFVSLLMCLRGSACIYQGEELGLTEADLAFDDLQDPYGIEFWPEFKGRDGCRTPMVWEASNSQGGFTTAVKPWLPVAPEHLRHAVAVADEETHSILHHYRLAIALRRMNPPLAKGTMDDIAVEGTTLRFVRQLAGEQLLCVFNIGGSDQSVILPDGQWQSVDNEHVTVTGGAPIVLGAWQSLVMKPEGDK